MKRLTLYIMYVSAMALQGTFVPRIIPRLHAIRLIWTAVSYYTLKLLLWDEEMN